MLGKACWSNYEMYPISGYFSKLGAHLTMLSDENRLKTFESALRESIVPGESVVVDIGTGTGILAMLAARLGAKRVYAIEVGNIANVAERIISKNGLNNQIGILRGRAADVKVPEKADIIVSETLGFTGLEENIMEIFADAVKKFGKPETVLIPSVIDVFVAPVTDNSVQKQLVDVWSKPIAGIDYSFLSELAQSNIFTRQVFDEDVLIGTEALVASAKLGDIPSNCGFKGISIIKHGGIVNGLAGWFVAKMTNKIDLSSAPIKNSLGNHWQQFFISFGDETKVQKDDELTINLTVANGFIWDIKHRRDGKLLKCIKLNNDRLDRILKGENL